MTVRHYSPSQNFNWNTNLANYIPHTICNDPVQKVVNVVMEIHNFGCERKILFSALFQLLLISNIHNNNKTHTHFVCLILFFVPYSLFFLSFWFCHFRWRAMSKKQLIATPNPTQPTLILYTHISHSSAQRHCFLINAHGYLLWKRFVFTLDKIVVSSGNRKKTKSRRAMHDPQLCLCDRGYGCAFIKWLLHTKFNFLLVSYRVCLCVICFFLSAYTEGKSNIFFITLQSNVYLHMRQTSHITHTHTHTLYSVLFYGMYYRNVHLEYIHLFVWMGWDFYYVKRESAGGNAKIQQKIKCLCTWIRAPFCYLHSVEQAESCEINRNIWKKKKMRVLRWAASKLWRMATLLWNRASSNHPNIEQLSTELLYMRNERPPRTWLDVLFDWKIRKLPDYKVDNENCVFAHQAWMSSFSLAFLLLVEEGGASACWMLCIFLLAHSFVVLLHSSRLVFNDIVFCSCNERSAAHRSDI